MGKEKTFVPGSSTMHGHTASPYRKPIGHTASPYRKPIGPQDPQHPFRKPECDCTGLNAAVVDIRKSISEEEKAVDDYHQRSVSLPVVSSRTKIVYNHIGREEFQHRQEFRNEEAALLGEIRKCSCPSPGGRTSFTGGKGGVSWGH
jgi:hypothetical protein